MDKLEIRLKCLALAVEYNKGKAIPFTNCIDNAKIMEHYVSGMSGDNPQATPENIPQTSPENRQAKTKK
jgi:hypothetical protein